MSLESFQVLISVDVNILYTVSYTSLRAHRHQIMTPLVLYATIEKLLYFVFDTNGNQNLFEHKDFASVWLPTRDTTFRWEPLT
jgi:hypothetical protein